jgi:hypothetical protein
MAPKYCTFCGVTDVKLFQCGLCKGKCHDELIVNYCSKTCQTFDWKYVHQNVCGPQVIKTVDKIKKYAIICLSARSTVGRPLQNLEIFLCERDPNWLFIGESPYGLVGIMNPSHVPDICKLKAPWPGLKTPTGDPIYGDIIMLFDSFEERNDFKLRLKLIFSDIRVDNPSV